MMTDEEIARRSQELVETMTPMLAGQGSAVQGAALSDLVSIWVAGHHPESRAEILLLFVETVAKLTAINAKFMFGKEGFPGLH
jgi:hypothetical protein